MKMKQAVAGLAVAGLALAGCSGGVGGGSGNSASAAGTIKLGMLAPSSGSESAFGTYMKNGAQLAINEINEAGGVNGAKLELIFEDDACDPATAVSGANKLVTQGIVASVGGYCSGSTIPTVDIFAAKNIPMVIPAANSNDLVKLVQQGKKNVFLINGTGAQQADTALKYAAHNKYTKVALLNDNTAYSKDLADTFAADAKKQSDVTVVLNEAVNPGEKDYSANVKNVIDSGADLLWYTGYYQEGGLIAKQLVAAGYKGHILVADGAVDKKIVAIAGDLGGTEIDGTFTQTPDMLEGQDQWISNYKAAFGADPGPYSNMSYDAVRVVAQAMKDAGSTDGAKVITALEGLKDFQLFSGKLTFTPDHTLSEGGFVIVKLTADGPEFKENPAQY